MKSKVASLYGMGLSRKDIAKRLEISESKVTHLLVDAGLIATEESIMLDDGMTVPEIAEALSKTEKAVQARIPYSKGIYNSDEPSINALRIRKHRENRKGTEHE